MPSTYAEIAHLLRRAGFGGLRPEIEALTEMEWADAVDHVLDTSANPPATQGIPNLDKNQTSWSERYNGMSHFWLDRARTVPAPIQEKMVLFWNGHLVSAMSKVNEHSMLFEQQQLFRTEGMGNVVNLMQKMALQPAMIEYLDNDRNVKGSPNENFARELMELFTLGQGHYTEDDVQASARAWTGHGLTRYQENVVKTYQFWPDRHDNDPKTFMGTTRNWDGPDIIDHIYNGPTRTAAARFMATKLWSFFSYPRPEEAIVSALASEFLAANFNITALLRAIFMRPEFRSQKAIDGLVRSPVEFVVAAMRHTGYACAEAQPQWYVDAMGQKLFDPPNVSGWRQNEYWISSAAMWAKARFADRIRWTAYNDGAFADYETFTIEASVARALETFGIPEVSPATETALVNFVTTERASERWAEQAGLLFLPMLTPEFQMA